MPWVFDCLKAVFCLALILMLCFEERVPESLVIAVAICWAALCIVGIILTLPLFFVIGMGAGAAQADWMSDGFVIVVIIILPTGLSILWSVFLKKRILKTVGSSRDRAEDV